MEEEKKKLPLYSEKRSFYMLHYSGRGEKLSGQSSRTLA